VHRFNIVNKTLLIFNSELAMLAWLNVLTRLHATGKCSVKGPVRSSPKVTHVAQMPKLLSKLLIGSNLNIYRAAEGNAVFVILMTVPVFCKSS
jgi:hypothetical protein